jgi:hypothetical protein
MNQRRPSSALIFGFQFNLRNAFGLFPFGGESGIFSGMTQDLPPIVVHPTGEQSAVALGGAPRQPLVKFRRFGASRMGSRDGFHATGSIAVLHRLSEDCGSVRFVRRR